MESYRTRGVEAGSVSHTAARLDSLGRWLKQRRSKVATEGIDADLMCEPVKEHVRSA